MWPGMIWPGTPLLAWLGLYLFSGPQTLYYPAYKDFATGHSLIAVPGQVYDIYPPSPSLGLPCAPADGFWTAVEG